MSNEIRALLTRHLSGYEVRSLAKLGGGLDNVVYEVNGELVVGLSRQADPATRGDSTRREAELLAALTGPSTLRIPGLVFADVDAGALAYANLPGLPLNQHPVPEPTRLATPLGEFLGSLHRAPLETFEHLAPRDTELPTTWLDEAERGFREIAGKLPAATRGLVEDFLGQPPPPETHTTAPNRSSNASPAAAPPSTRTPPHDEPIHGPSNLPRHWQGSEQRMSLVAPRLG